MKDDKIRPYSHTRVVKFLQKRMDEIKHRKSQYDIAMEAGYHKPNIISMMKNGDAKVPLEKVFILAKAFEVDPNILFRLALEQNFGQQDTYALTQMMNRTMTENELAWVEKIRAYTGDADPSLTQELESGLEKLLDNAERKTKTPA